MRFQTTTIHSGVDKDSAFNSVITPIYQTSTLTTTIPAVWASASGCSTCTMICWLQPAI